MRIFVRIFRNILFRILKKDMNEVRISDYRNSGMRIGGVGFLQKSIHLNHI